MENSKRGSPIQPDRTYNIARSGVSGKRNSDCRDNTNKRVGVYFWSIILLLITPLKAVANTTVASPSSNSSGTVNNNATQIIPGSWPVNRYSQGIQCTGPNISLSPYIVNSHSYGRPRETVTRTPIYDEDTGDVKYYSEIPRFEKDNYSKNFGVSLQFNIPFGRGIDLCHQAVKTNIKNQELLYKKSALEVALHTLKICSEQLKLGVRFRPGSKHAVVCSDIEIIPVPGQILPHVHPISLTPAASSSSQKQKAP